MLVCCPALHRNSWPPVGTNAFINLVLIKQSGEIARNYDYSVRGDMDDIVESKETVNYESIFSKYIGHQLSLLTIHHKLLIIDILWILSLHLNAHFAYMPNFFFLLFFQAHYHQPGSSSNHRNLENELSNPMYSVIYTNLIYAALTYFHVLIFIIQIYQS